MNCLKALRLALACSALMTMGLAYADPNDYVHMATVEEGEKEIDATWGIQKNKDGTYNSAESLALGVGATSWWFTEFYGRYQKSPGMANSFDSWEWENRFQLLETGKYPIDLGFLLEIERPKDRTLGYEINYGPLIQSEWGRIQGNLNLLFQKNVDAPTTYNTVFHYEMQIKYRQSSEFEWGAQAFGSTGPWNSWDSYSNQIHQFGPAIFGKIRLAPKQAITWNAALLRGITDASPVTTLRVQTEYEF